MTQLEEGAFNREKEERSSDVDANLDEEKSRRGREPDVVIGTKLGHEMDDELLYQICAVGNAGDEGGARNCNRTKWQSRADRANKKSGHAESDERELPDAGGDSEIFPFAEI